MCSIRCYSSRLFCLNFSAVYKGKTPPKLEDVLGLLANGFFKGGTGFLKSTSAGEMIKGGSSINGEVRVGITHVSILI